MAEEILTPQLSLNARTVLGSVFGWNTVLTYHMQDSVPSEEMQAALDELVAANMLLREQGLPDMPAHGKSVRYRVADGVNLAPLRKEAAEHVFDGTAPSIRVYIPRTVKVEP
jgi:hypothetical protein